MRFLLAVHDEPSFHSRRSLAAPAGDRSDRRRAQQVPPPFAYKLNHRFPDFQLEIKRRAPDPVLECDRVRRLSQLGGKRIERGLFLGAAWVLLIHVNLLDQLRGQAEDAGALQGDSGNHRLIDERQHNRGQGDQRERRHDVLLVDGHPANTPAGEQ
jgi:hypothetical protein